MFIVFFDNFHNFIHTNYGDFMRKIVVIGCGNVGMSYIFSVINQGICIDEIVMIDKNRDKTLGELEDLTHTLKYLSHSVKIKIGNYDDCNDADIICITAGVNEKIDSNNRLDDLEENNTILKEIISSIKLDKFRGIFLVASNPLDVITYLTQKYSGADYNRVIGSGTLLDSSRISYMISQNLEISPKSVNAYVLGEHGNSMFVAWSMATVGLEKMDYILNDSEKAELEQEVVKAGFDIIRKKGSTNYGIGVSLATITRCILEDERLILPVSNYDSNTGIYYSSPCIVGKNGIEKRLNMNLNDAEWETLNKSIDVLDNAIKKLQKNSSLNL